jgi:hypothetical protein
VKTLVRDADNPAKTNPDALVATESEDIFELMNLPPRMTGLLMSIWASPRGNARHDIRIKVNMSHGRNMAIENTAVVAIRPTPRVIAGELSTEDRLAVEQWIKLNYDAIIGYWNEDIDSGQFLEQLKLQPST